VYGKLKVGLTAWLVLLVIGAVVPLVALAWVTLHEISTSSQALLDQRQADTVRALALAVDGEVRSWKAALTSLAASRSIAPGRMAEFYEEAQQVAAQHEGWVVLTVASGEQLFNTLRPYGSPLSKTSSPETIEAIFREGKPIVSNVFYGKNAQQYLLAVAVPVVRGGKVVNCLTLNFSPQRLTQLLLRQQLPASWVAAINDRQRRVVARSVLADERIGKPVVEWFAAATRAAESGIVTGPLVDGRTGRLAFQTLQEVPWIVTLAVPTSELQSTRPIWKFILIAVTLGLAAVGVAVFSGRRIAAPVAHLAAAGGPLVRGEAVVLGAPSGIRQVRELQQVLGEAAASIQASYRERERAAENLRRANEALEARVQERTAALAKANEALQITNAALQEDIQRRKQAEEALRVSAQSLRESEERLRMAVESTALGTWDFDPVSGALNWSEHCKAVFGLAADAQVSYQTFLDRLHPDDRERVHTVVQQALDPAGSGHFDAEYRLRWPDGTERWIVSAGRAFFGTTNGRPCAVRFIGTVLDITERKRTEETIRSLAKFPTENPNPILRLSHLGTILYANGVSLRLLREWGCAVGSRAPDPWPDLIREALATRSQRTLDLRCGDVIYSIIIAPVSEADYVNLYASDITARKQAEESLQQTLAELERSNQELEQFAYVASHDLQEPLRMVSSFTQLLASRYQDRLDQQAKEFIAFAVDGATRMQRLIQDLLAYSRVTTRGGNLTPTDAQAALHGALSNLQTAIHEAGAVVTHDALPMVLADATQLKQVFQNLVGNAIKFHGDAPPRVRVSATLDGDDWVFAVADNGIGIDPKYFDRVFVIFQRLHPRERYPGTGIGLALCQRIVQRHGGRLWVESTPGQGATFYFTLKRQEGA
jgi:PAS domain S-box-containing protein